jgi:hypothetical protein
MYMYARSLDVEMSVLTKRGSSHVVSTDTSTSTDLAYIYMTAPSPGYYRHFNIYRLSIHIHNCSLSWLVQTLQHRQTYHTYTMYAKSVDVEVSVLTKRGSSHVYVC